MNNYIGQNYLQKKKPAVSHIKLLKSDPPVRPVDI